MNVTEIRIVAESGDVVYSAVNTYKDLYDAVMK